MLIIWVLVLVLIIAVLVMFFLLIKKQQHAVIDEQLIVNLEQKVDALELNLQKTLEIMQGFAKKMQVQQEVQDVTALKLQQVENQNADLVALVSDLVTLKESKR